MSHRDLSPSPDLNPKPYPRDIFILFFGGDFQNSTYPWRNPPFLLLLLFRSLISAVSKPLREVSNRRNSGRGGGTPLEEDCGRLYLNWRATMYDWDAWKCHGTCLTSGSTLQLQSRQSKRNPSPALLAFFVFCLLKNLSRNRNRPESFRATSIFLF